MTIVVISLSRLWALTTFVFFFHIIEDRGAQFSTLCLRMFVNYSQSGVIAIFKFSLWRKTPKKHGNIHHNFNDAQLFTENIQTALSEQLIV